MIQEPIIQEPVIQEPMIQEPLTQEQQAVLLLWQRVNTSLSAFYRLVSHFGSADKALGQTSEAWTSLRIHGKHVARHSDADTSKDNAFIETINQRMLAGDFQLLFYDSPHYPPQLNQLFDPPPLLFYKGDATVLSQAQIAIVGTRKPTPLAQKHTFDMAQYLAKVGYFITSGLAQGVDAQAHLGALAQDSEHAGRTIGVMGTGVDVCYPTQHQPLFDRIVNEGGCIISELLPGTPANKHTFPRRNRIVAGLSVGTIVTEAALKSGSLITARLTSEQGKQVFAIPSNIDNVNAEGCHHLIREGATLIYHPDQVIEDLNHQLTAPRAIAAQADAPLAPQETVNTANINEPVPALVPVSAVSQTSASTLLHNSTQPKPTNLSNQVKTTTLDVPDHLQSLWVHIDWDGQDLDALVSKTNLQTPDLLSQLMELELLGFITQMAGRYKRL